VAWALPGGRLTTRSSAPHLWLQQHDGHAQPPAGLARTLGLLQLHQRLLLMLTLVSPRCWLAAAAAAAAAEKVQLPDAHMGCIFTGKRKVARPCCLSSSSSSSSSAGWLRRVAAASGSHSSSAPPQHQLLLCRLRQVAHGAVSCCCCRRCRLTELLLVCTARCPLLLLLP
jgi:hypothetical protein